MNFNQASSSKSKLTALNSYTNRRTNNNNNNNNGWSSGSAQIKSVKLFGVDFNLNMDQLPGIDTITRLEITNLKTPSKSSPRSSIEFRSTRTYPNLTEFLFKNNQLKQLNTLNAFYLFTGLRIASFAQNQIDRIDKDTFRFATLRTLEELSLERNKLTRIERAAFAADNLSNLRTLNLNQNQIETVEERALGNLRSLETLDLTRNRLSYLNENTFAGLANLRRLLLSYNPFKAFDANAFKYVPNLSRLEIISNTESDWFTFDNSDVCLLSYFKCETQIFIDPDQRCNCFVKYVNFISAATADGGSGDNLEKLETTDVSVVWFKPCQLMTGKTKIINV